MKSIGILNQDGTMSNVHSNTIPISDYTDYAIPILHLNGSVSGMTKDEAVTLDYIYREKSGTCTVKWQGASSVGLPKKNYTIKFDNEFEVVSGWGAQKKYCLKANYVDSSHARNIVCAKLWGQIVKSRSTTNNTLNALPNSGAIDGFPILLAINGEFQGIYTWNIPKDDWMLGMDDTGLQAIVCAEFNNNGAVAFKGLATLAEDSSGQLDFDLEYSSDDKSDWVVSSLNRLISAVMNSDGTNIEYGITPYIDWDSAIDYYIHAVLTGNYDGVHRNYLLATYDGVKWFFTPYDMDVVLGLRAMGKYFYPANHDSVSFTTVASMHKLFELIWKYKRPQLRARYNELRSAILSVESVANAFVDFVADIPLTAYVDDVRRWNRIPSSSANSIAQIITYYDLRCRNADEWIKNTSGETAMPQQVNPSVCNVTNTLSNCTTSNSATTAAKGSKYSATITANNGYELNNVVVTMGGTDVTSTVYSNGVISISSVTGDVVITATATEKAKYTNQVPISIDTNKSVYNGVGWEGQCRLSSSSGSVKTGTNNAGVTGFIPVKSGNVVRFKDTTEGQRLQWNESSANNACCVIVYYNASFGYLGALTMQPAYYGICGQNSTGVAGVDTVGSTDNGGIVSFTVPTNADIAYVRMSISCVSTDGSDMAGLLVTVNEEIV